MHKPNLKRLICVATCLAISTLEAHAISCDVGYNFHDLYTSAKKNLSSGDYAGFFNEIEAISGRDLTREADEFSAILTGISSNGFKGCEQILFKKHSDIFVTEVIAYYNEDRRIVYLLTDAVALSGQWSIVRFRLSGSFDEISSLIGK